MPTLAATAPLRTTADASDLASVIDQALSRIPPLWPLKHFVAVNPFLGLVDRPFFDACATLQRTVGTLPLQTPAEYLAAFRSGTITPLDLASVDDEGWPTHRLIRALENPDTSVSTPIRTVADMLDSEKPRAHWSVFVVEEISKWCAIAFDENQTTWRSPWQKLGLYAAWHDAAAHDRNPEAFGLHKFRAFVQTLPAEPTAAIAFCLQLLDVRSLDPVDFLHRQLATISGWAGHAQYLAREDALRGRANPVLRDLLAIRLAYDTALYHAFANDHAFRTDWRAQKMPAPNATQLYALNRWQLAYELGYQRQLAAQLATQPGTVRAQRPSAQVVFCIDVRSERLRRHLETHDATIQTIGFAGFFGFPVAHQPPAAAAPGSRCPVLLVPPVETCEPLSPADAQAALSARAAAGAWKAFQNSATSCFSFVESAGLAFAAALGRRSPNAGPACSRVAPDFKSATVEQRAALAEGALRNMSLTRNFARLVLICGHGSQSANNPYASGLDCGACGGHAGDVNARLAAATFNAPAVRSLLAQRGIAIPDDTVFIASLHNTTTDDVTLFDLDRVPPSHAQDVTSLRTALAQAGAGVRAERAPSLGLAHTPADQLDEAVRARATDIAQVRPEWGLANNAALVAAPRSRTAHLNLDGRVFLHDYDASADPENKVLTLILCAPVVVASWINLQYYASRIDPERYGAGNKVLHNVSGGLGVFEGNGGDLKVGLPLQSIHDGEKFTHEARRLTVFIEAARQNIEAVLSANPGVRQLFDHGWLHLVAIEGNRTHRRMPNATWLAI